MIFRMSVDRMRRIQKRNNIIENIFDGPMPIIFMVLL